MSRDDAKQDPSAGFEAGHWEPEVAVALRQLVQRSPSDRQIAVFDFDNTCIAGDIGELYAHYLVETLRYRYDLEAFWDQIHPRDGRRRLRALTDEVLALQASNRRDTTAYEHYLAEMAGLYGRRLERAGKRDCYAWAVRLHVGLTVAQMRRWSREAIRRELQAPRRVECFQIAHGGSVQVQRGVRPFRAIQNLIATLDKVGYEVWIVSATNEWTVRQFAPLFGVSPNRVLGNRVALKGQQLTAETVSPALYREGKCEIIDRVIGKRPVFVAGDSITDYEMLCEATELALVIDSGDEFLQEQASQRGWAIQTQTKLETDESAHLPKGEAT